MRELAHETEDIIEYFMLEQVSTWPDYGTKENILELKRVIDNIDLIAKQMKEEDEVECAADSSGLNSSSTAPPICKDVMVGFEDLVIDLNDRLCGEPSKLQVIPICGMAGTGKTILARNVYDDPSVVHHFVIRVWVTISEYSSVQRTLSSLLECLKEFNTGGLGLGQSDEENVYQILTGRRYLVVMDGIWSNKAWDFVRNVFPDDSNGSRVMLTTRSCDVASYPNPSSKLYHMSLLSEEQSWNLFKQKVFGDEDCPDELENIGKEFASSCKGWPLAVVAIAKMYTTVRSDTSLEDSTEGISEGLGLEKVISSSYDESRSRRSAKQELHLKKVMEEIALIAAQVKKIKDGSTNKQVECGLDASAVSSSSTTPPIHTNSMIGFEEHVMELKGQLCGESSKLQVIPICGMGGIGKTTLAKNVYDNPLIVGRFDVRVWVTISQDYSAQRILSSLVESLKEYNTRSLGQSDDEIIHKILIGRRYLVVMDDIWSSEAWDVVRRVCPDDGNGSRIMLTTRLSDVASYPDTSSKVHEMSLLNADQSWNLLKQKVFADENCPSELVNIGKEIARRCKGLPLAIVVIAGLLSTATKNPTSWLEIAENLKSAQTAEQNQIEEILSLSYVHLPQYLRPCFLYMGSFLEDYEIPVKKLIRLWIAEGFVKSPSDSDSFEKVAEECLEELIKRNLVLATKWKQDCRIKSCNLHDLMRDLCIRKAHESNFFLNMMECRIGEKGFIENVSNQRRVNIDSSDLYYFSSLHGSTVRSIKCFRDGRWSLELRKSVRLLRVLDAEPLDALMHMDELFHLRYLAIRCYEYGDIPSSLSMLQNLQTLVIVEEKFGEIYESKGPDDLWLSWCMSQLRHVYYGGTILFHYPEESTCPLENLQTLSYVSHKCCTERILKLIPNLKKLKIKFSDDDDEGAVYLDNLVHMHRLEDLKINGVDWEGAQAKLTLPKSLKRLTLVSLNLPLGDIFIVGSLPNLQVLNLKYCTSVGGTWETTEGAFPALELLRIAVWLLETWITESSHFPRLKRLLLNSCMNLNGIPNDIGEIPTLEMITVTGDAKRSLVESVEQIRQEQEDYGNTLQVLCNAETRKRFQILGQINNDDEDDEDDDDDGDDDDGNDDDDDNNDDDDDVPFPLSKFKEARQ